MCGPPCRSGPRHTLTTRRPMLLSPAPADLGKILPSTVKWEPLGLVKGLLVQAGKADRSPGRFDQVVAAARVELNLK